MISLVLYFETGSLCYPGCHGTLDPSASVFLVQGFHVCATCPALGLFPPPGLLSRGQHISQHNLMLLSLISLLGPLRIATPRAGSECENGQACAHLVNTGQPADGQMPISKLCQQLVTPTHVLNPAHCLVFVNSILLENSRACCLSVDAFVLKL